MLGAVLSGVLLALCFPVYDVGDFVWVWAMPLMVVLWSLKSSKKRKRKGFFLGWLSGFAFWLMTVDWLLAMGDLDMVPRTGAWFAWIGLSFYLAVYFGIWGAFLVSVGNPWVKKTAKKGRKAKKKYRIDTLVEKKLANGKVKKFNLLSGFGSSIRVMRFAVMHASLWVVLEWVRGWLFTGFTWNGLGVAFHENATMAQAADLVGVVGLSFLPILVCSMLVQLARRMYEELCDGGKFKAHWEIVFTVGLVVMSFFYGIVKLQDVKNEEKIAVKVLMLQPNISQNEKWGNAEEQAKAYQWFADEKQRAFEKLKLRGIENAVKGAAESKKIQALESADVVVLPESALLHGLIYEGDVKHAQLLQHAGEVLRNDLLSGGEHAVIFGSNFYEGETVDAGMGAQLGMKYRGKDYNALAIAGKLERKLREIVDDEERVEDVVLSSLDVYGKVHLVPFGEYFPDIPFRETVYSTLYGSNPGMNFTKGESFDPLPLQVREMEVDVIPCVCFEDSVGRVTRKFVRNKPQMIVNVTNDGWFGESKAALQHMANAKFRAIELRRPMVRCANTGATCIIDASGSLVDDVTHEKQVLTDAEGSIFTKGHLYGYARVPVKPSLTLYALAGDLFVVLCAFMAFGLIIIGKLR